MQTCMGKCLQTLSLSDGMCSVAPIKPAETESQDVDSAWLETRSEDLELRDESTGHER